MSKRKKYKKKNFEKQDKRTEWIMIAIILIIALLGLLMGYLMVQGMDR